MSTLFEFATASFHGALALAFGAAFGLLGWGLAVGRVAPPASASVRLAAATVAALAAATGGFWVLALVGLFRLPVALPLVVLAAAWALRRAARAGFPLAALANDLRAAGRGLGAGLRGPSGWVFGALLVLVAVALVRGVVAPPLGWDGLTYHLLKAGRFVQAGHLVTERAPDAWRYYEYFPLGGDLLWAWGLLIFRDALLITPLAVLLWAAALLGLYGAARELGAPARVATQAAAAVGALPAVTTFLSSGYVDNTTLAFFALGTLFVLRVWRGATREAPLAAAALGCMVGVRLTTAPLLAVGGGLLALALLRAPGGRRARLATFGLCLAVGLLGAPTYLRAWLEQGSPFHPIRVVVAGRVLSPGAPLLYHTLDRVVGETPNADRSRPRWDSLFYASSPEGWYANPGPGAALLLALGGWGAVALGRRRRWGELAFLAIAAGVILGSLWSEEMTVYRVSDWAHTVGRLLLPGIAALALLGAVAADSARALVRRLVLGLLTGATAAGILWSLPRGLSRAEGPPTLAVFALGALCAGCLALLRRTAQGRPRLAAGLGLGLVALGLGAVDTLRAYERYPLYEDAARFPGGVYHLHPLNEYHVGAWPIWRELDRPEPLRLAVFAGWDGRGHNIYRFPLLGSRLQNLVLYVPITRDGSLVDGPDAEGIAEKSDFATWLGRLAAARVDVVVSLAPAIGIEAYWIEHTPELFEPLAADRWGLTQAYRFRSDRLQAKAGSPSGR